MLLYLLFHGLGSILSIETYNSDLIFVCPGTSACWGSWRSHARQNYRALNATCQPVLSCRLGFLLHVVANAKVCYEVDGSLQQISVNPEKSRPCCQAAANQKLLT